MRRVDYGEFGGYKSLILFWFLWEVIGEFWGEACYDLIYV